MSGDASAGALIAVDWGTSRLRARLLDAAGREVAATESGEGIGQISGGHEEVFERLVADWPKVPAMMAGMIGSRQGWREAAYLPCPASPDSLGGALLRFDTSVGRPVAIVPGVMLRSPQRGGDVMRGEETQLVGLMAGAPGFAGTAVLPGTHSKWVAIAGGRIADFETYMTGEMFELLSRQSFLRHSVADDGSELSTRPDFALAVRRTAQEGLPFLSAIFSVRARALLDGAGGPDNIAYLSGVVIGAEIAGAMATGHLKPDVPLRIVAAAKLAEAYVRALAIAGFAAEAVDGNAMALAGLIRLARAAGFLPKANA
ncbi:2-dehydro-3-deoxygalactonokinase [soil metagenome]